MGCTIVLWEDLDVIVCVLMLCCVSDNVCGLPIVSKIFIENGHP